MSYPKTLYGNGAYRICKDKREEDFAKALGFRDAVSIQEKKPVGEVLAPEFEQYAPVVDAATEIGGIVDVGPMRKRRKYTRRIKA